MAGVLWSGLFGGQLLLKELVWGLPTTEELPRRPFPDRVGHRCGGVWAPEPR